MWVDSSDDDDGENGTCGLQVSSKSPKKTERGRNNVDKARTREEEGGTEIARNLNNEQKY